MIPRERQPVSVAEAVGAVDFEAMLRGAGLVGGDLAPLAAEEIERNVAEQLRREAARRRRAALEATGVDEKHARMIVGGELRRGGRFAASATTIERALAWARGDRKILVLHGPKGRGKSLAANVAADALGGALVVPSALLVREVWWRADRPGAMGLQRRDVLRGGALVIDDVGQEPADDQAATAEVLATLVPHVAKRPGARLILTTNLAATSGGPGSLAAWLGAWAELVLVRVQEYGTVIHCGGPDLREGA